MRNFFEVMGFVMGVIALMFVLIGIAIAIALPLNKHDCKRLGENTSIETKYQFFGGACLLNIDGEWTPEARWINNTGN